MRQLKHIMACFFAVAVIAGCKKLVDVPLPALQQTSGAVYSNDATAAAVLTGVYTAISNESLVGENIQGISVATGLSSDELTLYGGASNYNPDLVQYYENQLSSTSSTSAGLWMDFYSRIYDVNLTIENLTSSETLTPGVKQQLMGEAEFMRAFFYFYLVNLYGEIPLVISSNVNVNSTLASSPQPVVYKQIISDLSAAESLLTNGYVASDAMSATSERVRPNKWAALALLARVYLYTQNWDSATICASQVINNTSLYQLSPLNDAFLKNSSEAIWQLQPVITGWNTQDARVFILPASGPTLSSNPGNPVYLGPDLVSAFEPGDLRRTEWVDSVSVNGSVYYFPYKYKSATLNAPVTEYLMMLRLGEQYLIRAEAEAYGAGGSIGAAIADLDTIRRRTDLPDYSGPMEQTSVLGAILHERQVELFTEWGHRWLDLKRTGKLDSVMTMTATAKSNSWNADWQYYPIPQSDIIQDPNLTQNQGY